MTRYVLHALGFIACLTISFRIATQVHFPKEELKNWISYEVQDRSNGNWLVNAEDLSLNGISSLKLTNVKVSSRSKPKEDHSVLTEFEEISLNTNLSDLLSGKYAGQIEAQVLQGQTAIDFELKDENSIGLNLNADQMNLALLPTEGKDWFMHLLGTANLKTKLEHNLVKVKKSEGTLDLALNNFSIENAKIMGIELATEFPKLAPITFTESVLSFELDKGKAKVTQGSLVSDLIQIDIGGHIKLNKKFSRSRLHLTMSMTIDDDIAGALKYHPKLKRALHDDGSFKFKIEGLYNKPKMLPNPKRKKSRSSKPKSNRRSTAPPKKTKANDLDTNNNTDGEETAAEKRRRERRERLEKRREERRERREKRAGMDIVRPNIINNSAITRDLPRNDDDDIGGSDNEPTNEDIQDADDVDGQQYDEDED